MPIALVWAIQKFKNYVWGMKVKVVTDHHSLCWLMKKKDLSGRLARWSLQLQDLDIEILHRSGRMHSDADALSRSPVDPPESEDDILTMSLFNLNQPADICVLQDSHPPFAKLKLALKERYPNKATRKLVRHFEIRNAKLFRRNIRNGLVYFQLCVPPSLTNQVLLACHDDKSAGHLGVSRTLDKIKKRYFWFGMRRDITQYVKSCADCQTKKRPLERPKGLMTSIRVTQPFEKVGIDLIGPFPRSKSGNRHVFVAVDYFTKWVITKASPNATTKELVDFFIKRIVLQHGAPVSLISDRGKCLTSDFAEKLFLALETNHLVTTAYHPQCNGLVERFNHTFAEMLSMYVDSSHDDWDESIDYVTFGYNTGRQESTGFSPFYLLYGREALLPIDVTLGNNPNPVALDESSQNVQQFVGRLSNIREIVKRRMLSVQNRQKKRYDKSHRTKTYQVGEQVLVYRPIRKKGRSEKLLHRYYGPYRIIARINDLNYQVELLFGRNKRRDCVHVDALKPFFTRKTYGPRKRKTARLELDQLDQNAPSGSSQNQSTSGVRQSCPTVEPNDCRGKSRRSCPVEEPNDHRVEDQRPCPDVEPNGRCELTRPCPVQEPSGRVGLPHSPRLIYDNLRSRDQPTRDPK